MALVKRILVGRPLATTEQEHQRIPKVIALAVFSSDAISSTAYATEEILFVTAVGASSLLLGLDTLIPIGIAIALLLAIVAFSYRQTIFAYPSGGGSYVVSRENLGEGPSLVAGASLLVDYILTVAVSISAGVLRALERLLVERHGTDVDEDERTDKAVHDERRDHHDVEVGRRGEQATGLLEAPQVRERDEHDQHDAEQHPMVLQVAQLGDRDDRGDAGGDRHGDGQHVVDQE